MEAIREKDTNVTIPWPIVARKQPTLEEALVKWEAAKTRLDEAKLEEMEARKLAFELAFGANAKEGANTLPLANDFELKATRKLNYGFRKPDGYRGTVADAVADVEDAFTKISNEGSFIGERLFKWKPELSVSEYRTLCEDAEISNVKAALLRELNTVLVITEGACTLEIKKKGKRK